MKVGWVSSWPPRSCGIATYSLELVEALRAEGVEVEIVCHRDGGKEGEKKVHPVIDLGETDWQEKFYLTVKKIAPDILHIQHEYGLYSRKDDFSSGLLYPLFRFKIDKKFPVVITYHSVYSKLDRGRSLFMDVAQRLVDAGIVHEEYQRICLPFNIGRMVKNIYVIPHGAKKDVCVSKKEAKKSLALEGKKIVGMIGWFAPTKGYHRVIKMWEFLSRELGPDTFLLIAGEARMGIGEQVEYKNKILSLVEKSRAKDKIKVVLGSFSPEEYEKILASFDLLVLPYTLISQSGNLAHSFSLGIPVVATAIEGLKAEIEASGAGIAVPPEDDFELARAILTLMKDDNLRKVYSKSALNYVKKKIAWPIIARKHIALYKKLLRTTGKPIKLIQ